MRTRGNSTYFVCMCVCVEFAAFMLSLYTKMNLPACFTLAFVDLKFCGLQQKAFVHKKDCFSRLLCSLQSIYKRLCILLYLWFSSHVEHVRRPYTALTTRYAWPGYTLICKHCNISLVCKSAKHGFNRTRFVIVRSKCVSRRRKGDASKEDERKSSTSLWNSRAKRRTLEKKERQS